MLYEPLMPAAGVLGEAVHVAYPPLIALGDLGGRMVVEALVRDHVGPRIKKHTVGTQTVASRASDLLVVALDRARPVAMDHVPDVGFVDAHAECHGRDDYVDVVAPERILRACAVGRV